jgi:hypothetical protein
VWFENCTVLTAKTSKPSRCSGSTAAAFPTCPYATHDWIERMAFIDGAAFAGGAFRT